LTTYFLGLDSYPVDSESIEKCSIEEFKKILSWIYFCHCFILSSQDDYHKAEDVMALTPSSRCLGTVSMMKDDNHNEMEIPTLPPPGWDTTPSELSRILRVFMFRYLSSFIMKFEKDETLTHPLSSEVQSRCNNAMLCCRALLISISQSINLLEQRNDSIVALLPCSGSLNIGIGKACGLKRGNIAVTKIEFEGWGRTAINPPPRVILGLSL
jgi:hypothetical protein